MTLHLKGWALAMHRLRDPDNLLLVALLVLHVVPLWVFPYFPSQDGPAHLENAVILRDYHRRPFLHEFYTLNTRPDPNWFGHLVLRGLIALLPLAAAEKVFLSGYVVLLPLAARYALESIRPGAGFLTVLAFPFIHNFLYHMGFYNFCYSLVVFFVVVGYYWRHADRLGLRQTAVLALLVVLLYFCHLVAVAVALLTIGALGLAWAVADVRIEQRTVAESIRTRLLLPVVTFLPAVALGLAFLGRQGTASVARIGLGTRAAWLWQLEVLVSYLNLERLLSITFFAGLVLLAGVVLFLRLRSRQLGRGDALLLVVVLALAAYFTAPSELAGGSFLNTRLLLFPFFALLLWLGGHPFAGVGKRLVQAGAALLALGMLGLHSLAYAEFNGYLDEYLSAEVRLLPDSTLLPVPFHRQQGVDGSRVASSKVGVFRHATGYLAARCGVVNLENYEATTGYFPVSYRSDVNPYEYLGVGGRGTDAGLQDDPPRFDIAAYTRTTGRTVDYVLLWNVPPENRRRPEDRAVFDQLGGYVEVFVSQRGLLRLYCREDRAAAREDR